MGKNDVMRGLPLFFSAGFFLIFASATVILVPVYFYYPSGIHLPLAVDAVLLLAALADFSFGPSPRRIQLRRPLPYPLAVDRPAEISIEIANRTSRTVHIIVTDDLPQGCTADSLPLAVTVPPRGDRTISYRVTPMERGDGVFGNINFWVRGSLGLVWKRGEASTEAVVKLYPGLALIKEHKLAVWRPVAYDPIRAARQRGGGTEFDSLREYVIGDDSRQIHWSTSARKGKPIVRQTRVERSQTILLVLDAGRMMTARVFGKTKFDHGLNAALLVAYSALDLGDKVGVMAVAQDVLCFLPPASVPGQFGRILDSTYTLMPKMEEPRFYLALSTVATRLRRRSLIIVFTDLIDERASEGLVRYSLGLLPRHLPLVVAMSDTEVVRLADSIPKMRQDLYRQAVAAGILERREHLMARLASQGVMVMDTTPERLSASVLDRYLRIKTRNLL